MAIPEEKLWKAVIIQAILDASNVSNAAPNEVSKIQQEAQRFLKGTPDFYYVCDMAGLCPDRVRTQAKKALSNGELRITFRMSHRRRGRGNRPD